MRAFSKIHEFRGESALFTWLYQITLNECRTRTRRTKVQVPIEERDDHSMSTHEEAVLQRILIDRVLDQLPEAMRLTLILREMHGLSYEEIAAVLKLPLGTVRSRLHEARRQFRRFWEAE